MDAILNFRNYQLNIPFSGIEKQLLLEQFGFGIKSDITDNSFLFEIEQRILLRLTDLLLVISQLPDNSTILDIGSGNSLIDLAICLNFPEKNFKFILVDDSDTFLKSDKNDKFYDDTNYKTYNNWSFANKVIESNGFIKENFIFKAPTDVWTESKVDLVISTASWGWHYPVDTYLDKVSGIIKDGGYIYIAPLLNVDNSLDKVLLLCPIVLTKILKEYQGSCCKYETAKVNSLIQEGRLSGNYFKYIFLGKVRKE